MENFITISACQLIFHFLHFKTTILVSYLRAQVPSLFSLWSVPSVDRRAPDRKELLYKFLPICCLNKNDTQSGFHCLKTAK